MLLHKLVNKDVWPKSMTHMGAQVSNQNLLWRKAICRLQLKSHSYRIYHYWHFQPKTELEKNSPAVVLSIMNAALNELKELWQSSSTAARRIAEDKYSRNFYLRTISINAFHQPSPNAETGGIQSPNSGQGACSSGNKQPAGKSD